MDNLPVVPDVSAQPSSVVPVVAAASSMKKTIIIASIAVVLAGAGLATWFSSSSDTSTTASIKGDAASDTPPSLQQQTSALKGSFVDSVNNCKGFTASDIATLKDASDKIIADNGPHMVLTAGLNIGYAKNRIALKEIVPTEPGCLILITYNQGVYSGYPDQRGQFGPSMTTLTDESTIEEGQAVIIFSKRPAKALIGLVDPKASVSGTVKWDDSYKGWALTALTPEVIKSAAAKNSILWIYDSNAPDARNGRPFSKIEGDLGTYQLKDSFVGWVRQGATGAGGIVAGSETTAPKEEPAVKEPVKTTTPETLASNMPTCSSTDPDNDIYTKGTITTYTPKYGKTISSEYCADANRNNLPRGEYLEELVCIKDDAEFAATHKVTKCENGCSDGACIRENPAPTLRQAPEPSLPPTSLSFDPTPEIEFTFGNVPPAFCPEGTYLSSVKSETGGITCNRIPELTLLPTVEAIEISCQLYQELTSGRMNRRLDPDTTSKVMELANDPLCNPASTEPAPDAAPKEPVVEETITLTPTEVVERRADVERTADMAEEEISKTSTPELSKEEEAALLARRRAAAAEAMKELANPVITDTTPSEPLAVVDLSPSFTCNPRAGARDERVELDIKGVNLDNVTTLTIGGMPESSAPMTQTASSAHYEFIIRPGTPLGVQDLIITNPRGSGRCIFNVGEATAERSVPTAVTEPVATPSTTKPKLILVP